MKKIKYTCDDKRDLEGLQSVKISIATSREMNNLGIEIKLR